ncbi:hypothetical protein A2778_01225 [Candidatus Daviesbacteria bacterium RIFCSPHIGHO2_01_FULL_40_24]|nr:MAG: hypothetical protein A2778_01225 [Candidatus Daviesbacteria bacterium RIFCSPHIGHO2_01_FULL_40_24]OGE29825.1 MAG: hypothetical protein A3C29_00850 [Candidatus Daviesbacteria bacterium RIFCSPHIGHO2_02_FULL_40_16]HCE31481.1 hypothetical protein [Candidatus Daviesbacteria bacterium]
MDLAIGGKTTYPTPPAAKVSRTLIRNDDSPKNGGISCEYMAARVANRNAKIRRKTSFIRTK